MSWRDRKRPASFRGVPFQVSENEALVGRRGVVNEFPGRDEPSTQDLGKRARRFTIQAFVIGEDYDLARDRLIEAVELPGPGELVHPYYGQIRATVDPNTAVSIRESESALGEAVIAITFVREGEQPTPSISVDTVARASATNARANAALAATFEASVDNSGPEGVRTNLIDTLTSALGFFARMNAKTTSTLSIVDRSSAKIRSVTSDAAALIMTPNRLVTDMIELHDSIFAGISRVTYATSSVAVRGRDVAQTLLGTHREAQDMSVAAAGLTAPDEGTTVGLKQARNQRAIIQATKVGATIAAAQTATKLLYDSHETAVEVGDELSAAIEAHVSESEDDVLSGALLDLQVVLRQHMKDVAARLPRIVTYTPQTALPACVIAYQVYGSLDREDDIVARNNVQHPGFCRGGEPLSLVAPNA